MDKPQLYGTPLSHFTRKIRILLMELAIDAGLAWLDAQVVAGFER